MTIKTKPSVSYRTFSTMSGIMQTKSNRGPGPMNEPFEVQGLIQALSEAVSLSTPPRLKPARAQVILDLEARLERLAAIRTTALRAYRKFEYDLSERLQSLRDAATRSWGWWNGEIMDQELMVAQVAVSGARLAAYRRSRDRCLAIADWATGARQFVRGAVEELDALCEKQRVQFAQVEKRVANLRADGVRERGAEMNIDDLLNGFQNISIHMEEELALPTILPLPVFFDEQDYQGWPEDERALVVEAHKLYDDYMNTAMVYELL